MVFPVEMSLAFDTEMFFVSAEAPGIFLGISSARSRDSVERALPGLFLCGGWRGAGLGAISGGAVRSARDRVDFQTYYARFSAGSTRVPPGIFPETQRNDFSRLSAIGLAKGSP